MNLLDRIKTGLLLLAGLFLFGCEDDDGLAFNIDEDSQLEFVEFTLETSNIAIDSFRTDFSNLVLTGDYIHEELGTVTAESYLQFQYDSGTILSDTLIFDYLEFSVEVNQILKNTSGNTYGFDIHLLNRPLYSQVVYLSDFYAEKNPEPIDEVEFSIFGDDDVDFDRANTFGRYLFEELISEDSLTEDYLGQISLTPKGELGALLGIAAREDSTYISIWTTGSQDTTESYETRFQFVNYYSGVTRDRQNDGNPISNLEEFSLGDHSIINPLFGVNTLADLAPLKEFASSNPNILVNKAEIITDYESDPDLSHKAIRYYFFKENFGISGEGRYIDPFNTLVLTNNSYLTGSYELLASPQASSGTYQSDITMFTEVFNRQFATQSEFLAEKLVLTGNVAVTLEESIIPVNSVKLRVYYTTAN